MGKYIDWALVEIERLGASLPAELRADAVAEAESHLHASAERLAHQGSNDPEREAVREFGSLEQYVAGLVDTHVKKSPARADPWTVGVAAAGAIWLTAVLVRGDFGSMNTWNLAMMPGLGVLFVVASFRTRRWQVLPLCITAAACTAVFLVTISLLWTGPVDYSPGAPNWMAEKERHDATMRAKMVRTWSLPHVEAKLAEYREAQKDPTRAAMAKMLASIQDERGYAIPSIRESDGILPSRPSQFYVVNVNDAASNWQRHVPNVVKKLEQAAQEEDQLASKWQQALSMPLPAKIMYWGVRVGWVGLAYAFCLLLINGLASAFGILASKRSRPTVTLS